MLFSRFKCIAGMIILVFIAILSDNYIAFMIFYIYMVCVLLSAISINIIKNKITIDIHMSGTMSKHKPKKMKIMVDNGSLLPVAKEVITLSLYNFTTGEKRKAEVKFSIAGKNKIENMLEIKSGYCGVIEIKVDDICIYDLFNIVTRKILCNYCKKIMVLPEITDFSVEVDHGIHMDYESNEYVEEKNGNDVNELFGYRDYYPGDSLRQINWKLSSKWNTLIVRENSIPVDHNILLLVDTSRDELLSIEETATLYDSQMEIIASISKTLLHDGYNHDIKWFDYYKNDWVTEHISDEGSFALMVQSALNVFRKNDNICSIERYLIDEQNNQYSHVINVTTRIMDKRILDNVLEDEITSIVIVNDETVVDGSFIAVTPENWKKELAYLAL